MKRILLLMIALLCSASLLMSQETKVVYRTLCLGIADQMESLIVPGKNPEGRQTIKLYTDLSPVIEGTFSTKDAMFYIETTGKDGVKKLELVAKARLGSAARQLMVFVPTGAELGSGKLPYLLKCYDDDLKSFGMGQIRAINMCPVPVRFVISGDTTPQIPPGKYVQFSHTKKVNEYDMYQVVTQFLDADKQWVIGQSVNWKSTERRREIVFTLIDTTFNQPIVRIFSDIPPWTERSPEGSANP